MSRPLRWVLSGLFALAIAAGLTFAAAELGASSPGLAANCIDTCPPLDPGTCYAACETAGFEHGGGCTPSGNCCCFK